jgi:hypothetical protein
MAKELFQVTAVFGNFEDRAEAERFRDNFRLTKGRNTFQQKSKDRGRDDLD